jgi:hypothetical protein
MQSKWETITETMATTVSTRVYAAVNNAVICALQDFTTQASLTNHENCARMKARQKESEDTVTIHMRDGEGNQLTGSPTRRPLALASQWEANLVCHFSLLATRVHLSQPCSLRDPSLIPTILILHNYS